MHASLFELVDEVVPKNHKLSIDAFTAAVSMCHDYETDYQNLQQLLQTNIRYIGLLGPRKRASKMFERINEESNTPFFIQEPRIHSPIGLDIGAKTPEEIALSACAEIQAFFAERNSLPLKFRLQTIYE
jgi:xanthine/CO dehydrogenase XdhC/CoxF family maturation factor